MLTLHMPRKPGDFTCMQRDQITREGGPRRARGRASGGFVMEDAHPLSQESSSCNPKTRRPTRQDKWRRLVKSTPRTADSRFEYSSTRLLEWADERATLHMKDSIEPSSKSLQNTALEKRFREANRRTNHERHNQ